MDKKQTEENNIYDEPTPDIQDQISKLMGDPDQREPEVEYKNKTINKEDKETLKKAVDISKNDIEDEIPNKNRYTDESVNEKADISEEINSPETDAAVTEILKQEGETLLKLQDDNNQKLNNAEIPKQRTIFKKVLTSKILRYVLLLIFISIAVVFFAVPEARYFVLNKAGVKAGLSMKVTDEISGRPVKNVRVTINDQFANTDENGNVTFNGLRLGESEIVLSKRSFEEKSYPVVLGWGSNPFEAPFEIVPTGTSYVFMVKKWVDDQPLEGATVTDGESEAISNKDGIAELKIEKPSDQDLNAVVSYDGYISQEFTIASEETEIQNVKLVPSKPDIFISKRSGNYDVYSRSIDGSNEHIILNGSGNEQSDIHVVSSPEKTGIAALSSSRAGERDDQGNLQTELYIIDANDKNAIKAEGSAADRLEIIGWSGDRVIYSKYFSDPDPTLSKQTIASYDIKSGNTVELATAGHFNDFELIDNKLYYAIYIDDKINQEKGLTVINVNGSDKKNIIQDNAWSITRTNFDDFLVNSDGNKWYQVKIQNNFVSELNGQPADLQNVIFVDNKNTGKVARLEKVDGKNSIIINEDGKDKTLARGSGVGLPIVWLSNDTILYGVQNPEETAHYVVSTGISEPKKVGDVSLSQWQAY